MALRRGGGVLNAGGGTWRQQFRVTLAHTRSSLIEVGGVERDRLEKRRARRVQSLLVSTWPSSSKSARSNATTIGSLQWRGSRTLSPACGGAHVLDYRGIFWVVYARQRRATHEARNLWGHGAWTRDRARTGVRTERPSRRLCRNGYTFVREQALSPLNDGEIIRSDLREVFPLEGTVRA